MISRRLVRIKAMQTYYSYLQQKEELQKEKVWNLLYGNFSKSYELYISLHCLLLAISDFASDRIEIKKNKYLATTEELNPNTRFINNIVFPSISKNKIIAKYYNDEFYNWSDCENLIRELWQLIEDSNAYQNYMSSQSTTAKDDIKIINYILINIIPHNERVEEYLEEKSVYWNDELELIIANILKGISKIKSHNHDYTLLPIFNSQEDEDFAKKLITTVVSKTITYDKILSDELKMWDLERVAFLDRVILHLAICEVLEFPEIPISVTIDEWIEIAKYYSTEKSNKFINGLVDKIFTKFKNEKKIFK